MLGTYGESDKILALLSKCYYHGINSDTGERFNNCNRLQKIGYAPAVAEGITGHKKAWENAERYYKRRVKIGRELLLERMKSSEIAA